MKITQFDKARCKLVADAINAVLPTIGAHFGISLKIGRGRFNATAYTIKLEAAVIDATGQAISKEVTAFRRKAVEYGLAATDFGREFVFNGERYKVTGLKAKASRFPILGTRIPDGKVFKFPGSIVRAGLQ